MMVLLDTIRNKETDRMGRVFERYGTSRNYVWRDQTQLCLEGPIDRYVQFISKLDRKHYRMLVGLLTGHINLQ